MQNGCEIHVLNLHLQNNGKNLKAFADINIDGLIVRDFRVLQSPGQKAYVVSPQVSWRSPGGQIRYKTLIVMPNGTRWQVESSILSAYSQAVQRAGAGENGEKNPQG